MPANFTELTRVQIPALLHLERLGYTFVPREKLGENQDLNSNILTDVFKESVRRLNPAMREAEIEKKLRPGASKLYRKQYSKLDTFIQALLRQKTAINN